MKLRLGKNTIKVESEQVCEVLMIAAVFKHLRDAVEEEADVDLGEFQQTHWDRGGCRLYLATRSASLSCIS